MAKTCICNQCGTISKGKTITRGNILVEIVLWCLFLLPGLIYSAWRHLSRRTGCTACGSAELIPLDTPRGAKLAREFETE